MMELYERTLVPAPQRWISSGETFRWPATVKVALGGLADPEKSPCWTILRDDIAHLLKRPAVLVASPREAHVALACRNAAGPDRLLPEEGYALRVTPQGVSVSADAPQGLFYGVQTLCQLLTLLLDKGGEPSVRCCEITDWPTHGVRWLSLDMGRAVFTPALLRRAVRVASRLKYNGIHWHLHENEMNPVRYEGTPLGSENPFALPIAEYARLIAYARDYHVEIMPELESWGHAGSILQHYPHLYGASRLHGYGHSFAIGPQTFDLLERMYDPWVAVLPSGSRLNVGLDEANWRLAAGADPAVYNRKTLVRHLHDRVQARAKAHGKSIQVMVWGGGVKHADVFVPPELRDEVLMGPWHYRSAEGAREQMMRHWIRDTKRFNAKGQMRSPFIAVGGTTGIHEFGCFEATLEFARLGKEFPNCLGLNVCNWASNDLHGRMPGIFFGAAAAWSPNEAERLLRRDMAMPVTTEEGIGFMSHLARTWQATCRDAEPAALDADRGEEVLMGRYRYGPKRGQYVVPVWMPETVLRGDQPEPGEVR
jgi:hypothetical protein